MKHKAVQVVLEEDLLRETDREARRGKLNRSQFVREALREYLARRRRREMEERDRRGYERNPPEKGEFDAWDKEAAWPDD